jgi:hypothetical protein
MVDFVDLETASNKIRDDYQTVAWSVQRSLAKQYKFASDRLKDDENLAKLALRVGLPEQLQYASNRIRSDKNFIKPYISASRGDRYFEYVSDSLKSDEEFCLEILKEKSNSDIYIHVDPSLRNNLDFFKKALSLNPEIIGALCVAKMPIDNDEIALHLFKTIPEYGYDCFSDRLKNEIGDKNLIEYLESKLANKI